MLVYLAYVVSPLIVQVLFSMRYSADSQIRGDEKKNYLIICGIIIFLMVGLRSYSLGATDGRYYYNNWKYMSEVPLRELSTVLTTIDIESGYLISVWILSRFLGNPQFVFVCTGLLYAVSICRFLYKNCDNPCLGLIVFNCFGLFNFMVQGIRQGIAIAICLFAVEYCKKRKLLPFLCIVALASSMHASAFIFCVAYVLYNAKLNLKWITIVSATIAVGSLAMPRLLNIVNVIMNENYPIGQTDHTVVGPNTIFIYVSMLLLGFMLKPNENYLSEYDDSFDVEDTSSYAAFYYLALISFVTFMMRFSVSTVAVRMSYYFMIFYGPIVSTAIKRFTRTSQTAVLCAIYGLFVYLAIHKAAYLAIVPYTFFWQGV